MSEDRIVQALQALAEKDRGLQAASQTEALLVREFRRRRAKGGRRRVSIGLTTGVVAAGIAVTAFVVTNRPSPAHRQATVISSVAAISTVNAAPPVHVPPPVHAATPIHAARPLCCGPSWRNSL